MATNPRIPSREVTDQGKTGPQLVPGRPAPKRPGSGVPGVLAGIVVAIALLAAILYYMPRAPKKTPPPSAAQIPTQPAGGQLQFADIQMAPAPNGGAVNLTGQVMNAGSRPILGAMVKLTFRDTSGGRAGSVTSPVQGMSGKDRTPQQDSFYTNPLKPNATRFFRITADRIPERWNHHLPEMEVLTVSADGNQ